MRPRRTCVPLALVVVLAALLLAATGCAGSEQPTATSSDVSSGTPTGSLRVGLTEWTIEHSARVLRPGRVTVVVTNTGATEHDLVVSDGRHRWATDDLRPGAQQVLSLTARAGARLQLWCAEPGHRAQGMHTSLRVSDGP